MKLISLKQLRKKSKKSLIKFYLKMEAKALSKMPKEKLCALCYKANKSLLPNLRTTKQKALPKRKTKSKKKLKPGLHFVKINDVMRKVRVLPNGKWRFEKMVTSLSTRRR